MQTKKLISRLLGMKAKINSIHNSVVDSAEQLDLIDETSLASDLWMLSHDLGNALTQLDFTVERLTEIGDEGLS